MSAASNNTAAGSKPSEDHSNKRARDDRDVDESKDNDAEQPTQSVTHVAPVTRLYRHALECVFAFLPLADLGRVLSVSQSWSAAVRSTPSIGTSVLGSSGRVGVSSLASHVGSLHSSGPTIAAVHLFLISLRCRSLTSMWCTVDMAQSPHVFFAPSLQSLVLQLKGDEARAPSTNDAIAVISQLPQLTDLLLHVPTFWPALNFAPLAAAAQLQSLSLSRSDSVQPALHHLDQIRMLPQLRKMHLPLLSFDGLAHLLRLPHSLQWREIHSLYHIDGAAAAALSNLPSLTKLDAYLCNSVSFLPFLPRLRALHLCADETEQLAADITAGLAACSQLTQLTLETEDVTSQFLSQVLSQLPLLSDLSVINCDALDSLSFLSEDARLAQSLECLELSGCDPPIVPVMELEHILSLANLTELTIVRMFVEPLDEGTQQLLTPPSVVLPRLQRFLYRPN